ncbi:hypothetical protein SEA_EDUGATOR_82 [Mycobacterium phage Edugator]|uniref:Uncharacterized protein n=4 Tax=Kratiovirus larva TaxID=1056831 RepID=A0A221J7B8_9CAUD|nr:hypothetical protein CL76_gp15 [Mycobacterium phage Larva]ASM62594.1 hypothetical protein SEA_ALLEYCAT_88 [Mycobacterium phage AlleyCat]ASR85779.1 hypothetical protein SEA_EDUGATOR_82 [Mycobacterium phage Edugator]QQV92688.1 hypothetical protein SEA_PSYCHO_86 [Mycobacterium phage Psycho]WAB09769.1 hypothetical protein SEA_DADOSKY_88 [Mycobacterium phage Dadosky]AEL19735.1 hypothetical protein LARVA_87 [Mycobacterium phage Larva]
MDMQTVYALADQVNERDCHSSLMSVARRFGYRGDSWLDAVEHLVGNGVTTVSEVLAINS